MSGERSVGHSDDEWTCDCGAPLTFTGECTDPYGHREMEMEDEAEVARRGQGEREMSTTRRTFLGGLAVGGGVAWFLCEVFHHAGGPWHYSTRMVGGTDPVPVREMEPYGSGPYQEYRDGRWVDVPYEERGPHYMETYPR